MRRRSLRLLAGVGLAALVCIPSVAVAQSLGTAEAFAVLGGSTVTNTGPTTIRGALGLSPGTSIVGATDITLYGELHQTDAVADQAQTDLTTAYTNLAGMACGTNLGIPLVELGGSNLTPGVYCMGSAAVTGTLTLDALGDPNAVWVFQIGSTLTTATDSTISFVNGVGSPCNVYWQVGSSATLLARTAFVGNILTGASITLNNSATVQGRVLAQRPGAVTLDTNTIDASICGVPVTSTPIPIPVPTLPEWALIALMALLALAGFAAVRRRTA